MTESSWPPSVDTAAEANVLAGSNETETLASPSGGRGRLLVGLLIGGLVFMTAVAATFLTLWLGNSDIEAGDVGSYIDEQRPEVEETARAAADILINYDSTNIDERRDEMLSIATGDFRADYEEVTATLGGALESAAASSTGSILDEPRVTFLSPTEADVTMNTEQITQTRENPTGRKISYILRVSLLDTADGWKVDNIEILSTGSS